MIVDPGLIKSAQKRLETALRRALPTQGRRNIGYPGGNEDHVVYSEGAGSLYCAFSPPRRDSGVPRYWNSFGIFRPEASAQQIAVEINVPVAGDDGRVAGFFAMAGDSNDVFLMHDGGVGGGRPGIGKDSFLAWLPDRTVQVEGKNRVRHALPIAHLADPNLPWLIWRFVRKAHAFKQAAVSGTLADGDLFAGRGDDVDSEAGEDYFPEFFGRKRGQWASVIDYMTYHGMIVDELKAYRERTLTPDEKVGKTRLIDLLVSKGGRRIEVYEVKTRADRQALYTAIGQLVTHGRGDTRRVLVIPEGEFLFEDCSLALHSLGVEIRRYKLTGRGMQARVEILATSGNTAGGSAS